MNTAFKIIGGIFAAIGIGQCLLVLFRDTPPGGGPPPPLTDAIFPGLIGLFGILLFIRSSERWNDLVGDSEYWRRFFDPLKITILIVVILVGHYLV